MRYNSGRYKFNSIPRNFHLRKMLINVTYKKFCKIVINDETKINNLFAFISNYQADKFAVKEYLVLNHKILGKLNNLNFYNLFESNQRREIYFNIFQSLNY